MADTQTDSQQQNVVTYIGEGPSRKPMVDLKPGLWVYPLTVEQHSARKKLHFNLNPYTEESIREPLVEISPVFREDGAEVEVNINEVSSPADFVRNHFVALTNVAIDDKGTEPSVDQKRMFLEANPHLYGRIFRECIMGGIKLAPEAEEDVTKAFFILDMNARGSEVKMEVELVDPKAQTILIPVVHKMAKESEKDRSRYNRAQKTRMRTHKGEWRVATNYDIIRNLYNNLVEGLEGILLEGQPLTANNKTAWVDLVPFFWKVTAINELFKAVRVKNS